MLRGGESANLPLNLNDPRGICECQGLMIVVGAVEQVAPIQRLSLVTLLLGRDWCDVNHLRPCSVPRALSRGC